MVARMKTTIEIADALLEAARKAADREGITLRALVERSLRQTLATRRTPAPFRLQLPTFKGDGLHPQAEDAGWERLRAATYEGRGA
jgi:hypothetical protein